MGIFPAQISKYVFWYTKDNVVSDVASCFFLLELLLNCQNLAFREKPLLWFNRNLSPLSGPSKSESKSNLFGLSTV